MTGIEAGLELIRRGVLEVRPDGTVWKLKHIKGPAFKGPHRCESRSKHGYLMVRLCLDARVFLVAAHRLVWTALRGPIPEGLDINHLNGVRHDNRPENLEPATRSENHRHAYRVLGRPLSKTCRPPVLEAIAERAQSLRDQGLSYSEIGRTLGVSQTTAFNAVRMRRAA